MAESRTPGFTTSPLVQEMHLDILHSLDWLPPGEAARTAFVMPNPDGPSFSYAFEALNQTARRRRVAAEIWVPVGRDRDYWQVETRDDLRYCLDGHTPSDDGKTLALIRELNERKDAEHLGLDGLVILGPMPSQAMDVAVAELIDPELDVDGMAADPLITPATPDAMARTAGHILRRRQKGLALGKLAGEEIVVLGNGMVNGPLVADVLPSYGIKVPPENHYKGKDDLDAGAERLATDPDIRLAFSATRRAAHIRRIGRGVVLVDVGNAINPETGRPSGNAHPELVAQSGDPRDPDARIITAFRGGAGPVTIATVNARSARRRATRQSRSKGLGAAA